MSSHGLTHRAFAVSHQRVVLDINLNGQINAYTELIIIPLSSELNTVHLHSSNCTIKSIYHTKNQNLDYILNEPPPIKIPDPHSVKQFPEAKRRLFERVNEKGTGELSISIDQTRLKKIEKSSELNYQHQINLKDKEIEFEPINICIEYHIGLNEIESNYGICWVEDENFPHVFNNPISPRSWVPCVDVLWERSTWELEIVVPKHINTRDFDLLPITVIGSGELIEKVIHPNQSNKIIFHYSQSIPTSVQHIGWAVGPFVVNDLTNHRNDLDLDENHQSIETHHVDENLLNQNSHEIKLYAFSLPNRSKELKYTTNFMSHALRFFTQEYGSYPFSSYKLVFVDMFSANKSLGTSFNSATLTIHPSDLLYKKELIDQVYETKNILVHSLISQWVGINIIPKSPSDTWLINGLSIYINGLYFKTLWGLNEYKFKIKKDILRCVKLDYNKPPICQPGLSEVIDQDILSFINLKSSLVLFILDRHLRRSGGGTSLGLSRVIPKIFLSAISGEMKESKLSTNNFLRICKKLNGTDLRYWSNQWIFSSGTPIFEVYLNFNKKKNCIELTLKQINQCKNYYESKSIESNSSSTSTNVSWEEKTNLKPLNNFEGQMSIRINEIDGIPYEHVLEIKENVKKFELPINTKYKRTKKLSKRYNNNNNNNNNENIEEINDERFTFKEWDQSKEERDKWNVIDWNEDEDLIGLGTCFDWIRLDVENEWICGFKWIEHKDFMLIEQLQRDKDVIGQLEAIEALKEFPSMVISSHLCKTVLTTDYFFRIRTEAIFGLVSCATKQCNYLGLFHLLKLFQTYFCFKPKQETKHFNEFRNIPKPNQFNDLIEYFIKKALVVAISRVRDHSSRSPIVCQQFFLDQLTYNDNSMNSYSDVHYLSTLITAMSDCFMYCSNLIQPDDGSELFVSYSNHNQLSIEGGGERLWAMVSELDRCLVMDRLVPSYRNLVTTAVMEAKLKLMLASLIPVDIKFFLGCTRPGNYPPIRILAFDCLLLLKAFQDKAIVRYMFKVMQEDQSLIVKRRLASGLVQILPILVLMEELAVEPKKSGFSIIDDHNEIIKTKIRFDHKNVTKALKSEVGRALILRECLVSVMLDPNVDLDVQTCLLKLSEVLFKASDETVPPKLALEIPTNTASTVELLTPTLPKIRIPAPSSAVEPQVDKVLSPRIVLKDRTQLSSSGEPDSIVPAEAPTAASITSPIKLVPSLVKKPKPAPKPKKFQASGMTIPDHKLCQSLLKKLASNPLGAPFRRPVDPIRQGAPDYFNIISNPMDFKTMSDKLEMGQYPDREAFRDDFNLVIQNCKTYNLADSPLVTRHAEPMKVMFDKQWERSEKTMNAVQAKGIGGTGTGWMKPTDPKPLLPSTNAPPLAPPPSFAAFAAGGSMIPAPVPLTPAPAPPPSIPDPPRPSALKITLKSRPPGPLSAPFALDSPTMPPPSSKPPLRIKFGSSSGPSPSTPSSRTPTGFSRASGPTFPAPPPPTFPISSTPTYPAPPPPSIASLSTPSIQPPPPPPSLHTISATLPLPKAPRPQPTFPAPPPPTLESLSVTQQLSRPIDSSSLPRTGENITLETPTPQISSKPPSLSNSQPSTSLTALPEPIIKKTSIVAKLSKPPNLGTLPPAPSSLPPHLVPSSSGASDSIATPPAHVPPVSSVSSSVSATKATTTPSIKIKVVKRSINPATPSATAEKLPMPSPHPLTPVSVPKPAKVSKASKASQAMAKAAVVASATAIASVEKVQSPSLNPVPPPIIQPIPPSTPVESKKSKSKKVASHHTPVQDVPSRSSPALSSSAIPSTSRGYTEGGTASPSNQLTSNTTELGGGSGLMTRQDPILPKKAKAILKMLIDHPTGVWFRLPVDPIKDGAPTYLEEIQNPMDLSTMLKKIDLNEYKYQNELYEDFNLIVSNCLKFNGKESEIYKTVLILESIWLKEWEKSLKLSIKEKKSLMNLLTKLNQVPGAEIFGVPVDPVLLQIPNYYEIIGGKEKARDLGTIKKKLNLDVYKNIEEFERDIKQMLLNCFLFNPPFTPVEQIGRDLEKVFDNLMSRIKKDSGLPINNHQHQHHHHYNNNNIEIPSSSSSSSFSNNNNNNLLNSGNVVVNKRKGIENSGGGGSSGSNSISKKTKLR
ncbi:hypothetical protein CROQUDRAFT_655590 [Cronartium quercuum f. sp. fusiforme G11]|uniref:Transcription initiation factor TFIID subunit 2 n=1 Tax=Cronartium quercuum f. sp. fusiforme G11 TaxID=708437 RepID=A0A9P6NQQ5_9BASI|nr:hypothetical protein CROQUDRAFT_655590 [Cronartium quercuum f. sp. fusiforme G11]